MRLGITDAVKHLLIINVLMFIGTLAIGNGELFFRWFALYFPKNDFFEPWQIITHMFMHGNFGHILFNMFALWMFGTAVEQVFGFRKFLIFYLFSGLGAATIMIAYYYFQYLPLEANLIESGLLTTEIREMLANNEITRAITDDQRMMLQQMFEIYHSSMVGASGAIMGVLVAFGMLFPESKLMLIFLPIPIKAKYFIPGIIALDLFSAITGQSIFSPSNTAYVAHIGGALTGFLLMWFWKKNENDKYRWN
jgi:membrane associated rhomboid family serine protease